MSAPARLYRKLLKTVTTTFRNDDLMLNAARAEIKAKFEAAKGDADPDVIAHRLAEGEEAADFISNCIVQTKKTSDGSFEVDDHSAAILATHANEPEAVAGGR